MFARKLKARSSTCVTLGRQRKQRNVEARKAGGKATRDIEPSVGLLRTKDVNQKNPTRKITEKQREKESVRTFSKSLTVDWFVLLE